MTWRSAAILTISFLSLTQGVDGHCYQLSPPSRQVYNSPVFKETNGKNDQTFEYQPSFYNARGQMAIKTRAKANTDPAVLAEYGNGDEWPLKLAFDKGEVHENGNYYQREELSVRHGICGDPKQVGPEDTNVYSTPSKDWPVLETFQSGSVLDIKAVMRFYHWGHLEFFLCNAADMEDPNGVVTQTCLNKYPLTRAADDSSNSPIDPAFPGRYYVDPECRENEVNQSKPDGAEEGQVMHMRYQLPDITCERCILQMIYYAANNCKHVGYDEFEPASWPSSCAPSKSQWVLTEKRILCGTDGAYPEEFWQCSDIKIEFGSPTDPTPATTAPPVDAPLPAPTTASPETESPVLSETKAPVAAPTPEPVGVTPGPVASTPASTSAPTAGSVSEDEQCVEEVQPYEQCGGGDFEGSTCCRPGYECIDVASCYSLCRPALNGCADSWRQCGGTNYEGPGCCWAGATCTFESENLAYCKPDDVF